jgi:DNA phosphorothioation-dependent restriction protein DptG
MKKIELKQTGSGSLESNYLTKNGTFRNHSTGNQLKIFPFKTNPSGDVFIEDFKSFQGIVGELFRVSNNKEQLDFTSKEESYKTFLKTTIIKNAISKVETKNKEEFRSMLSNLFFNDDNTLMKFNVKTINYMNLISSNNAIKDFSKFIKEIFLKDDNSITQLDEKNENDNILHQLIVDCLPELSNVKSKSSLIPYSNLFPGISELFKVDFYFLSKDVSFLLQHIEDLFKYYSFFYFTQVSLKLNSFGLGNTEVVPIFFSLDWETLSESRLSAQVPGWKELNKNYDSIFAHANTLELLNYIIVDNQKIGDYLQIQNLIKSLSPDEKTTFKNKIAELNSFYTSIINVFDPGYNWNHCEDLLRTVLISKKIDDEFVLEIYSLWYRIKYQFINSPRKTPYQNYSKWLTSFTKVNYIKNRGRLGATTVLSQEMLLFLTRLCIGNESKIRLKTLWDNLKLRGIVFDEISKLEITKLFEKINLIEKKSDSGDAQYIKSTI